MGHGLRDERAHVISKTASIDERVAKRADELQEAHYKKTGKELERNDAIAIAMKDPILVSAYYRDAY